MFARAESVLLAVALFSFGHGPSFAQQTGPEPEPPVPSAAIGAVATDAVRVALVDSGVDYTLPLINKALARHSEGPARGGIVGIDFRDLDARPWDARYTPRGVRRHGTQVASVLLDEAPGVALVPYRFPGQDMRLMHALVEHAAANGVRAIGLPLGSDNPEQWQAFERAAHAHPEMLFIASAGNDGRDLDGRPLYPASLTLDNMVVVTSADDFGRPSRESGTGRGSVDYLVPAEAVPVLGFGGERRIAAGSSYAVPRVLALAARLFQSDPTMDASSVVAWLRRFHANGAIPRHIGQGIIVDPLHDTVADIATTSLSSGVRNALSTDTNTSEESGITVEVDVFVLDADWDDTRVATALEQTGKILSMCGLRLEARRAERVDLASYPRLGDLHIGAAHTLFRRLDRGGSQRVPALMFARDTRMQQAFDAEAFGRGNTRHRPWMTDSVWLTLALEDDGIALAHELFHVLANDGSHVNTPGNLMLARTTGDNTLLEAAQCERVGQGLR